MEQLGNWKILGKRKNYMIKRIFPKLNHYYDSKKIILMMEKTAIQRWQNFSSLVCIVIPTIISSKG